MSIEQSVMPVATRHRHILHYCIYCCNDFNPDWPNIDGQWRWCICNLSMYTSPSCRSSHLHLITLCGIPNLMSSIHIFEAYPIWCLLSRSFFSASILCVVPLKVVKWTPPWRVNLFITGCMWPKPSQSPRSSQREIVTLVGGNTKPWLNRPAGNTLFN